MGYVKMYGNLSRKEELQQINRTARELAELICGKPEYETLYNDLKLAIEGNEHEIFELMKYEEETYV